MTSKSFLMPSSDRFPAVTSLLHTIQSEQGWRPPANEWDDSPSSPASTPPPLDDMELPSFEDSQLDPLVASNLTPLELSTPQFDFPDPSHGSPSSIQAEFDQDQDTDFDSNGIYTGDGDNSWGEIPTAYSQPGDTVKDLTSGHTQGSVDKEGKLPKPAL